MKIGSDSNVAYFRGERVYYVKPWPDTYNFHMYVTLLATDFTDAELVMFVDSDLMLVHPASLTDFTEDSKPIIYYEETANLLAHQDPTMKVHCRTWYPIMEKFLGVRPTRDYMAAFPLLYWADTIQGVRRLITQQTGKSVEDALYSSTPFKPERFTSHYFTFCDYEILGMWAHLYDPKRYCFRHAGKRSEAKTRLYHSWSQWSDKTRDELEKLLASS